MLLRRHLKPKKMSANLDTYVRKLLPLLVFLYSLGQYLFVSELSDGHNWSVIVPLVASGAYVLLFPLVPIRKLVRKFTRGQKEELFYKD